MRQRAPDPWSPVRHRGHQDHGHRGSSPMMCWQGVLSIFFLFLLCVDTTSCLRELYFPWPPEAQGPATLWKWCFSTFQAQSPGWWPRLECKPTHLAIKRAYFFFFFRVCIFDCLCKPKKKWQQEIERVLNSFLLDTLTKTTKTSLS